MQKITRTIARALLIFCYSLVVSLIYTQPVFANTPPFHKDNPSVTQQEPEESPLNVEVDRSSLTTSEILILKVHVRLDRFTLSAPKPQLPPLDDFNIVSSSTSNQVSMVNGKFSSETVYEYRLQPLGSGELTIGAVRLTVDGVTYSSEPISVHVSADTTAPEISPSAEVPQEMGAQDLYVEAVLDNPTPYVGEAVRYTFRLYQVFDLYNQPYYAPPDFTGFWSETDANQRRYNLTSDGNTVSVTELDTLLFPTRSGELVIEPAELKIKDVLLNTSIELQTEPIQVQVKPLPDGAPQGFNVAVGQFEIQAVLGEAQGKVNQPLLLTITLSGNGNIQNLPDPTYPTIEGWRDYESRTVIDKELRDGKLSGSRIYERLLMPSEAGEFEIPPVTYVYFDPQDAAYHTIHSEAIPVTVLPEETDTGVTENTGNSETAKAENNDIRHSHSVNRLQQNLPADLSRQPLYWAAWCIPLLVIGGSLLYEHHQRKQAQRIKSLRRFNAARRAMAQIKAARRETVNPCERASHILNAYLGDKLNQQVHALTQPVLLGFLEKEGVSASQCQRLKDFYETCDAARFSQPAATCPQPDAAIYDEAYNLVEALEQAFTAVEPHIIKGKTAQ